MPRSILGTLTLATTVVFAAPIALAGVFEVAGGDYVLGGVFVAIAALMIAFEEFLLTPSDLPVAAVQAVVGKVVEPPDEANDDARNDDR